MANARSILALAALVGAAAADPIREPEAASFPARSAAPLVYVYVPGPLGAATWAERQLEDVRLGAGVPTHGGDGTAISPLFFVDRTPMPEERPKSKPEPRREAPARQAPELPAPPDAAADARMLGALEAMGLRPEDMVEKPELPAAALALADAIARLDALLTVRRPREDEPGVARMRVDPEERRARRPSYVRHAKPQEDPEPKVDHYTLYAKQVTRSLYKMLLGVAIGILIWGFVRDTG
ncbi:MAG TPA: hypothetical protein VFY93_14765 [Planctomycetota bacterium]|nr:hypothetical protein [Planctomycetota bacterium]